MDQSEWSTAKSEDEVTSVPISDFHLFHSLNPGQLLFSNRSFSHDTSSTSSGVLQLHQTVQQISREAHLEALALRFHSYRS